MLVALLLASAILGIYLARGVRAQFGDGDPNSNNENPQYYCDTNGDGVNDSGYLVDTNGDGVDDACSDPPPPPTYYCDTNGDGTNDSGYLYDTNGDGVNDSCLPPPPPPTYHCDTNGDGTNDADYLCDTNGDGTNDACYVCDSGSGVADSCYVCDTGVGFANTCFLCDSDHDGELDGCYNQDFDEDGINDTCNNCDDLGGAIQLQVKDGPAVTVTLSETLQAQHDPYNCWWWWDCYDCCEYTGYNVASITVPVKDPLGNGTVNLTVSGADVHVWMSEGKVCGIYLTWSSEGNPAATLYDHGHFRLQLFSFSVWLWKNYGEDTYSLSSQSASARLFINGETHLGGPVYLTADQEVTISYSFSGTNTWDGSWNIQPLGEIGLEIRKDGVTPVAGGTITTSGSTTSGGFSLQMYTDVTWKMGYLDLGVGAGSSASGTFDLSNGSISLTQANLVLVASPQAPLQFSGKLKLALGYNSTSPNAAWTVGISGENLKAYSFSVPNVDLHAAFNDNLRFANISGSIELEYASLHPTSGTDGRFKVSEFTIEDGKLKTFNGSFSGKYSTFQVSIQGLQYDASHPEKTTVAIDSASIDMQFSAANAALQIENAKIGPGAGGTPEITLSKISGHYVQAGLFDLNVAANFTKTAQEIGFSGDMKAKFNGVGNLDAYVSFGEVLSGAPSAPFHYGAFKLEPSLATPITVAPPLPIALYGVGVGFGFNCVPAYKDVSGVSHSEQHTYGAYWVYGSMTVGDSAGFAKLKGAVAVNFGSTIPTSLAVSGDLDIPANSPFFHGHLDCQYTFGSGAIGGDLSGDLKIPPGNGNLIQLAGGVHYAVSGSGFNITTQTGTPIGGKVLNLIDLSNGTVTLSGAFDANNPNLTGTFSGNASATLKGQYTSNASARPYAVGATCDSGINVANCSTTPGALCYYCYKYSTNDADWTGIFATFTFDFNGNASLAFSPTTLTFNTTVHATVTYAGGVYVYGVDSAGLNGAQNLDVTLSYNSADSKLYGAVTVDFGTYFGHDISVNVSSSLTL
jgi:hypothetical protein